MLFARDVSTASIEGDKGVSHVVKGIRAIDVPVVGRGEEGMQFTPDDGY